MNVLIVNRGMVAAPRLEKACLGAGYRTQVADNLFRALRLVRATSFDFILLIHGTDKNTDDGADGAGVCRQLRATGVQSWVLLLGQGVGYVEGLDAGADDVVLAPVEEEEVIARMRALVRRRGLDAAPLRVGDLVLDPVTRAASRGGKVIHLSPTEYALLEFLMRHEGKTLTRKMILDHVWGYDGFACGDNVLDCYISYLRAKIHKEHEPLIHTERGVGFRLETSAQNLAEKLKGGKRALYASPIIGAGAVSPGSSPKKPSVSVQIR